MRVILAMQLKMTCCAYRLCIANAGKHFKPPHPRFGNIFWIGRGGWIPWPSLAFSFAPLPLPAFLSFHTCLHFERILDPQRCPLAEVPLVFAPLGALWGPRNGLFLIGGVSPRGPAPRSLALPHSLALRWAPPRRPRSTAWAPPRRIRTIRTISNPYRIASHPYLVSTSTVFQ
jgi:hypothetical protein